MTSENHLYQWKVIERQDWQVWFLSTVLLLIVGAGLLSFMFPAVFWDQATPLLRSPERAFFGFGVLYVLTLVYLLRRHATVGHLRRALIAAQEDVVEMKRKADSELLHALPSLVSFRDSLAMEFRRASMASNPLGAAIVSLAPVEEHHLGTVAKIFTSTLRAGESIFRISDNGFGLILPKMAANDITALVARVESVCALPSGALSLTAVSYPSDVASLAEMEGKLRKLKLSA